jgi:hypothetical protein
MQSFGVPPRAQYRFGGSDVRHMHEYFLGAVHVEYLAAWALGLEYRSQLQTGSIGSIADNRATQRQHYRQNLFHGIDPSGS